MIVAFPRLIHLCEFEMAANIIVVDAKADLCRLVGTGICAPLLFSEQQRSPGS